MTGAFAIQRPTGANAIDLWSSSFAPRHSVQAPSTLGLASVRCHSASVTSECHFAAPPHYSLNQKFSVLILLRRLFLLAARHSVQAPSALAPLRRFRFSLQTKNKSFPFSAFSFPFIYIPLRRYA